MRRAMTLARKRRIHARESGICWICREPVPVSGADVRYDHRIALWLTQDDSDAGIYPIHKTCDAGKTPLDLKRIAKTKRQQKMNDPRPPSRIASRPFPATSGPIPSRPFSRPPVALEPTK